MLLEQVEEFVVREHAALLLVVGEHQLEQLVDGRLAVVRQLVEHLDRVGVEIVVLLRPRDDQLRAVKKKGSGGRRWA